ncbi:hypothetical protein BDA99DRAFT_544263 [Phascolomyces articulosus]|uniref:Uncharacterized protein n=1 Tax=Phascolomyces articulosus TaxID=60185 RepID=A0AAD5JKL0_9FUNG|nr:hypothetical protein BDA99DRAFT_544263 [Phascolomyces articulosus]
MLKENSKDSKQKACSQQQHKKCSCNYKNEFFYELFVLIPLSHYFEILTLSKKKIILNKSSLFLLSTLFANPALSAFWNMTGYTYCQDPVVYEEDGKWYRQS